MTHTPMSTTFVWTSDDAPQVVAPTQRTSIDMVTPTIACETLGLENELVVELVNRGELAAYRIAGEIRFRITDVEALATQQLAA